MSSILSAFARPCPIFVALLDEGLETPEDAMLSELQTFERTPGKRSSRRSGANIILQLGQKTVSMAEQDSGGAGILDRTSSDVAFYRCRG